MDFDEYQHAASKTAIYQKEVRFFYPALGLCGEAGEVAEKIKKYLRDGEIDRELLAKELGDTLWYIAALCTEWGLNMNEVACVNIDKLRKRQEQNKLHGSGDER